MNIIKKGLSFLGENPDLHRRFCRGLVKLASSGNVVPLTVDWRVDSLKDLGPEAKNPYGEEGNVQGKVSFNFSDVRISFKAAFALKRRGNSWTLLRDSSGEPVAVLFEKTNVSQAHFKEKIKRPVRDNELSEALVTIIGKDRLSTSSMGIQTQATVQKLKEAGTQQMMLVSLGNSVWVVQFDMTPLWGQLSVDVVNLKVLPKCLQFTKDLLVNILNEAMR